MQKRTRIGWLVGLLVMVMVVEGCSTRYRYVEGQLAQAELEAEATSYAGIHQDGGELPGTVVRRPWFSLETPIRWPWAARPTLVYQKRDGQEYVLETGETTAQVLAKLGEPISRTQDSADAAEELWEYYFASLYFRRGQLKRLVFKETERDVVFEEYKLLKIGN